MNRKIRSYLLRKFNRIKMSFKVFYNIVAVAFLVSVIVLSLPRSFYLFDSNVEKFSDIKKRIIEDKRLVEKTCARYLGSINPLPRPKPLKTGSCGMCYYIDEDNKRGYCVNAKVIDSDRSKSLMIY